jgi:hypothetical protein
MEGLMQVKRKTSTEQITKGGKPLIIPKEFESQAKPQKTAVPDSSTLAAKIDSKEPQQSTAAVLLAKKREKK